MLIIFERSEILRCSKKKNYSTTQSGSIWLNKVGRQRALEENCIFHQILIAFLTIATTFDVAPLWDRAQIKALI